MSKQRILFLNVVIVLLVAISLLGIVVDREHWPFSQYPMYSEVQREYSLSGLRLFAVMQVEPQHEMPLRDFDYIRPFDQSRLTKALLRIKDEDNPKKRQQLLNEALLDCLTRYEKLRLTGHHDGPPLQGIRLYQLQWQLDARAENVDQPDHWELVAEVEQP